MGSEVFPRKFHDVNEYENKCILRGLTLNGKISINLSQLQRQPAKQGRVETDTLHKLIENI